MSKEKQIEEMTESLCDIECKGLKCNVCDRYGCEYRMQAEALYNAGYRKQSEGEWLDTGDEELDKIYSGYKCSACGFIICGHSGKYCCECGAKMKGGAE